MIITLYNIIILINNITWLLYFVIIILYNDISPLTDLPPLIRYPLELLQARPEANEHVRIHSSFCKDSTCSDGYWSCYTHNAGDNGVSQTTFPGEGVREGGYYTLTP